MVCARSPDDWCGMVQLAETRKNPVSEEELKEILGQVASACAGAHAP